MAANVDTLNFVQRIQLAWRLMRDERVASWVKKVGPVAIIAYVLSPIDVIPDFLIGPGQVDDLGLVAIGLVIVLRMLVRFTPDDIVNEHIGHITGTRWSGAPSGGFGNSETIDTSGRVRR
jgi:uncharacterized membrane protein YkvA (DUF1232 family)